VPGKKKMLMPLSVVFILRILWDINCMLYVGVGIAGRTINDISEMIFCVLPFNLIAGAAESLVGVLKAFAVVEFP
jgi:hypothetical protein